MYQAVHNDKEKQIWYYSLNQIMLYIHMFKRDKLVLIKQSYRIVILFSNQCKLLKRGQASMRFHHTVPIRELP
jgi:hypothetical protein